MITQRSVVIEPGRGPWLGQGNFQIRRIVGKMTGVSRPDVNIVRRSMNERSGEHGSLSCSRDNRRGGHIIERRQVFLGGSVYVGRLVEQGGIALAPRRNLVVATPTVHKWSTLLGDIG